MASPLLPVARQFVQHVQTKLAANDRKTYDAFRRTLMKYLNRRIESSLLVSIVQNLFQNHPDLLDGFYAFVPLKLAAAAAPTAKESDLTASVDFLNRVRNRLRGGKLYPKFLNFMSAYSRKEMSDSEVCDMVVGLLGKNDDLVDEFMCFLPKSMRKRKIDDQTDLDPEFGPLQKQRKRRRGSTSNSGSGSDDRRTHFPRQRRRTKEEEAAQKIKKRDREMEESMCMVDVRIANLESSKESALTLGYLLLNGGVSAENFRLDEHFTPLNLAYMDKKLQDDMNVDVSIALPKLIQSLNKEKELLEKERVKIGQKWKKILTILHS